jgi:hypothetical protein
MTTQQLRSEIEQAEAVGADSTRLVAMRAQLADSIARDKVNEYNAGAAAAIAAKPQHDQLVKQALTHLAAVVATVKAARSLRESVYVGNEQFTSHISDRVLPDLSGTLHAAVADAVALHGLSTADADALLS